MKIHFTTDDNILLDSIDIVETSRPDYATADQELYDDNLYLDERESILESVESSLKFIQRKREAEEYERDHAAGLTVRNSHDSRDSETERFNTP